MGGKCIYPCQPSSGSCSERESALARLVDGSLMPRPTHCSCPGGGAEARRRSSIHLVWPHRAPASRPPNAERLHVARGSGPPRHAPYRPTRLSKPHNRSQGLTSDHSWGRPPASIFKQFRDGRDYGKANRKDQLKLLILLFLWRREWDSNPRWCHHHGGFQDRCLKPLGHLSVCGAL